MLKTSLKILFLAFLLGCSNSQDVPQSRNRSPGSSTTLLPKDLAFEHSTEHAGFMAIVDLDSFRLSLPGTDLDRVPDELLKQMNLQRAFAWGCPEGDFQVRITSAPFKSQSNQTSRITSGYLTTKGAVCLTSSDHVMFFAQYPQYKLPQIENSRFSDRVFTVPAGQYKVTVKQHFLWTIGAQFAEPLNEQEYYTIYMEASDGAQRSEFQAIPWLKWAKQRANKKE